VSGKAWRYEFAAVKTERGLKFTSRKFFDRAISTLGTGEMLRVIVERPQDTRSSQQNKGLWGPIYDQLLAGVAEEIGYDAHDKAGKELMHEGLLQLFSGTTVDPVTKREVAKERSSTMTAARFREFTEWIARWAAEQHGVVITLPGEL